MIRSAAADIRLKGFTMKLHRRRFLHLAAGGAALPVISQRASALDYPSRPVRIIVGFPAGLTPDIIARLIAQSLSERLGENLIVDNRPGAASNIAADVAAHAPADGYTLLYVTVTNAINATLYRGLHFDIVRDITPVAGVIRAPDVMVLNPSVPAKTVPEFIAYAKANPGKINYASAGIGTEPNVAGELFKEMTGVDLVYVPYQNSYLPDLLSGRVQLTFAPIPTLIDNIKAGKLRALAMTGTTRSEVLPNIPTVAQFVPGYEAYVWHGIGAPRGTPSEIITKLNNEINIVLAGSSMKSRLVGLGTEPMSMTPAAFGRFISDETDKWAKVIKVAGLKVE
jgi:tripartite-type tricarboxylate transporter receptor subunit TctC